MLIRAHDRSDDEGRWRAFVTSQGFGHFVAAGAGRDLPVVVPTQFVLAGDRVVFHLAAANPVLDALAENPMALLSVAGDWAFIPGAWKAVGDEDPRLGLPTTYYAAVQLAGPCRVEDDPDRIAGVLRTQLADVDHAGDLVDPSEHGTKLRAIRAVTLQIADVRAKFKYGGNVDQAHRDAVAARLAERDGPGDRAALAHMATDGTGHPGPRTDGGSSR